MYFILFALAVAWCVALLFGGLEFDRALLFAFYAGDRPRLADVARFVTDLGGWEVLVPLSLAGAAWLAWRGRVKASLLLLAMTLGGRLLVALQKEVTARIRPEEYEHLAAATGMSFPSGHAANSTLTYVALALLLTSTARARGFAVAAAVWLALAIGASRVLLGVHWPSDVVGGWAFGLFWALLLLTLAGLDAGDGTPRLLPHSSRQRRETMTNDDKRGEQRADEARRTDDSDLLESMDEAPSHGDRSGHGIGRDVGTRDELKQAVGDPSVTRARDSDKEDGANLPRFNQGNSKLNP